jgi:hypothetical protein
MALSTARRLREAFAGADHCPPELVQLLDEIDLPADGKVGKTFASRLFRGKHFL